MVETLVYIFSFGAFLSAFLVISSTNPVHSVFSLVMCFANTSILLLLLGFEFLALLFLIVYVGALAILFLFVVMMLNVRLVELIENSTRYVPIGSILGAVFLLELLLIADEQYSMSPTTNSLKYFISNNNFYYDINNLTNIETLGQFLYTEGFIYFIISSIVLLVAMIGAIVMTLYHEQEVKRQDIFSQITTDVKLTHLQSIHSSFNNIIPDFRLRS
jgi:NADH:ubiquinone oxidoreductase subunit 6 (subunit J)